MKLYLSLLTLALAFITTAAHAATLEIANESSLNASIGDWRGIKVPSLCEDLKPCWVEVNQKFVPAPGLENLRGSKQIDLQPGQTINLYVDGGARGTYNIYESCRNLGSADIGYFFQLSGEAHLKDIGFLSICLVDERARLFID